MICKVVRTAVMAAALFVVFFSFLPAVNAQTSQLNKVNTINGANPWGQYIATTTAANRRQPTHFMLVAVRPHTRLARLQQQFTVARRLDATHFIIESPPDFKPDHKLVLQCWPANNLWKLSPVAVGAHGAETHTYHLQVTNVAAFRAAIAPLAAAITVLGAVPNTNVIRLSANEGTVVQHLLPMPTVRFIDRVNGRVQEESNVRGLYLNQNCINTLHRLYPELAGAGQVVSVKEQQYNTEDIDIRNRHIESGLGGPFNTNHATDMATIIVGAGNSSLNGRGVAREAQVTASGFTDDGQTFPDADADYARLKVNVQNHSYGESFIENSFYGTSAAAYDANTNRNTSLLHVFSSGNLGDGVDSLGTYRLLPGYSSMTGEFKMAKNIITVGAIDTTFAIEDRSSRGPAYDGRVKPALVAYSQTGSSNSAAMTSGVALLMQQWYQQQHGTAAPAALLKAILLNSADDVGRPGIDYFTGYGNLNARRAMETLQNGYFIEGTVAHGLATSFALPVPEGAINLKVTLVWNDPAAAANSNTALVNDLDLTVANSQPTTEQQWLPWVLSTFPHVDSLAKLPVRKADHLNNAEQVTVSTPPQGGNYQVTVTGFDIPQGPQGFYVAYQWDTPDSFIWTYPMATDNLPDDGEQLSYLRWEHSFAPGTTGSIDVSYDGGNTWQLLEANASLDAQRYRWLPPEVYSVAQVRMRVGANTSISEPFTISRPLRMAVGFNCEDSVLLQWPTIEGASGYVATALGQRYLETVYTGTDTFFVVQKADELSRFYAVEPIINGKPGLRSFTLDYNNQGIGCYVRSFVVESIHEEGVNLSVVLGTGYQVAGVAIERLANGLWQTEGAFTTGFFDTLTVFDHDPFQGPNTYRAIITLANGQQIITPEETVLFLDQATFLLFPNPVSQNGGLNIVGKDFPGQQLFFKLYNINGELLLNLELFSAREVLSLYPYGKGLYFYELTAGTARQTGKIVID